jgi:hypothetical protein
VTPVLFRGGPARALERWYEKPPPEVIVERGVEYRRTGAVSKGREVWEPVEGEKSTEAEHEIVAISRGL